MDALSYCQDKARKAVPPVIADAIGQRLDILTEPVSGIEVRLKTVMEILYRLGITTIKRHLPFVLFEKSIWNSGIIFKNRFCLQADAPDDRKIAAMHAVGGRFDEGDHIGHRAKESLELGLEFQGFV